MSDEIQKRHDRITLTFGKYGWGQCLGRTAEFIHQDRATLLAKVDELKTTNKMAGNVFDARVEELQARLDAMKPYLDHKGTCRLPIWGHQKDGDYVGYGKCTCGLEVLKQEQGGE